MAKKLNPATEGKLKVLPDGFVENEWLESLLRMRRERPDTYERSISRPLQLTVERYAELKQRACDAE
jgi:hypothetical protein